MELNYEPEMSPDVIICQAARNAPPVKYVAGMCTYRSACAGPPYMFALVLVGV